MATSDRFDVSCIDDDHRRLYLRMLLYPTFVLRDGCLLFEAHCANDNFAQNWRALAVIDPATVEQRINHVHLSGIESNLEAQRQLGMRIRRAWHAALERQHPELRCELRLYLWRHETGTEWVLDLQQMR